MIETEKSAAKDQEKTALILGVIVGVVLGLIALAVASHFGLIIVQ